MPDDIKNQPFWEKLTFEGQMLTKELFEQYRLREKDKETAKRRSKYLVIFILIILIASVLIASYLKADFYTLVLICGGAVAIFYGIYEGLFGKAETNNFEKSREALIEIVDIGLFKIGYDRDYKDEFIKYMYNHKIDLIHRK
ncbi:hypothetical protein [Clostridium thermarum]|uniref:hypothetical protein n=1 Tax=Clostridium thermarum TaxID=1716543 RepID=UPI0013D87FE0|nr:hypothetical protein [Clostridium thermarum]